MKILLVCEHGGHLTELLKIMDAFEDHEVTIVTNISPRTIKLPYRRYLIEPIQTNPLRMLKSAIFFFRLFHEERVDTIVSTGAEIALPAFIVAKFFKIKTIFIESWCRIYTRSKTGKVLYYLSDIFLVQWPQLLKMYGSRAKFVGSVME